MSEIIQTQSDAANRDNSVRFWQQQLALADKEEGAWRKRARKVLDRYRDEKQSGDRQRLNILWANTEILKPAIYSQTPTPDVRRRFMDHDPVAREASEIMERALAFAIDDYDFDGAMEASRDDVIIVGRGCARVRLKGDVVRHEVETIELSDPSGMMVPVHMANGARVMEPEEDEDGSLYSEEVGEQSFCAEYVHWQDVRFSPARRWEEVWWIAYRHQWTRDDLIEEFGEEGRKITLTMSETGENKEDAQRPKDEFRRAEVWEIWDKNARERVWIATGHKDVIRVDDDPLGLEGFFDMPEPVYAISTTDTMVPIPEFCLYQDQADELDNITTRINALVDACKVRGVYHAVSSSIERMLEGDDNAMIPMEGLNMALNEVDLRRLVMFLPIDTVAAALAQLYRQREMLKQEIFELTGLSDIVRGATHATETARAQSIKASFGSMRMTPRQKPMQRFIRDLFRLLGELMVEHVTPENLSAMTGRQVTPEVMALLQDDRLRSFRVDIESDSTVRPDMEQAQAEATQFLEASASYMTAIAPIVAQAPEMAAMLLNAFKQASRRFKFSRDLEEDIDQAVDSLVQRISQPQQPQADPMALEQEKAKAQLQIEQAKTQGQLSLQAQKQQGELALKARGQQMDAALKARQPQGVQ